MQISSMGGDSLAQMLQQMQQKVQTNFKAADTDGDGKLSKTEFSAFDAAMKAGAPQGAGGASGMPSSDDMFSMLDGDGDGSVTLAEAETPPQQPISSDGMQALLQAQEDAQSTGQTTDGGLDSAFSANMKKIETAFKAADKDGDGKLSPSEFSDFETAMKAQTQGAGSTTTTASADSTFSKLDTDGDGSVSLSEVMKGLHGGHHHTAQAATATDTTTADATTDTTAPTATADASGSSGSGGAGGGGKTYDPRDTNKDGVVSPAELAAAAANGGGGAGDMISGLIQKLLSNYTNGGSDLASSLFSAV